MTNGLDGIYCGNVRYRQWIAIQLGRLALCQLSYPRRC